MAREKRVNIPGVKRRPDGRFTIRAKWIDPRTGKDDEFKLTIEATDELDAAQQRASELTRRLALQGGARPERERLGAALESWLSTKRGEVRASTADKYRTAVERWSDAIGDHYLDTVTPVTVREVLLGWRKAGLRTSTINTRLLMLRTFCKNTNNPQILNGMTVLNETPEEILSANLDTGRGLSPTELRAFLRAGPIACAHVPDKRGRLRKSMPHWWWRAWSLAATMAWTGLRFGEATAAEWRDLDLADGYLDVTRAQWRGIVDGPKTAAGLRRVKLSSHLVEILKVHRANLVADHYPVSGSALVFPSRRKGKALVCNTYVRKTVLTICAAAKIDLEERPALHCLRHTWNNLLRRHGSEEVRRSQIGHVSEVRTYTHVSLEEQTETVNAVVSYLTRDDA